MNLNEAFLELVDKNEFDFNSVDSTLKSICKKLNDVYYDEKSETSHIVLAGSAGRKTLIKGSDIDFCFILPNDVFERFKNRKGNIQSQLLSEISSKIKERYPNSDIGADGQVIDANFKRTLIEIVPSFKEYEMLDQLTYPNTHDNGSWLTTNPINQQKVVNDFLKIYPSYIYLCKIIRCWRLESDVKISGIVIDSLIHYFLNSQTDITYCAPPSNFDFLEKIKHFFDFLCSDNCPEVIQIIGENDFINTKKNNFKKKAKKAYNKMAVADVSDLWDNLIDLFGAGFPDNPSEDVRNNGEMFIQNMYPVKITHNLVIDCDVVSNGFRTFRLRERENNQLYNTFFVPVRMSLEFYIKECDVPEPYRIFWKVRNVGKKARERNDIRGSIVLGDKKTQRKKYF